MNIRPITEWTLYRFRFMLAYIIVAVLCIGLLILFSGSIPPGLNATEMQSVVTSAAIPFTELPKDIINLPYHALQKLSVDLLGITPLGVRLPSLIFGALTVICLAITLHRWFKPHIALAATVIIVTSSWFLVLARLGEPTIMIAFWTSLLLLAATYVSQLTSSWKWWRVLFFMAAAISLYTPFMAYLFIAAALASISQPHLRYILRESNRVNLLIGGFFFALLLVPLGWGIYHNPAIARDLLGIPASLPEPLVYAHGLVDVGSQLVNPYNISTGALVLPLLSAVSAALLLVGGARLLKDIHSVRSHFLLIWAALLLPVIGLHPNSLAILFVPAMIVITIGLNQLIRYWYRLFPFNPYARLFGLLPILVLLISIVHVNYERYMYGMLYSAHAGIVFTPDAFLVQQVVNNQDNPQTPITIIVPEHQQALYTVMADRGENIRVSTGAQAPQQRTGIWIIEQSERRHFSGEQFVRSPTDLLVTDRKDNALRFEVYER